MIGILLVSHGRIADEMKKVMEHIVGPQENIETVCIFSTDDMEQKRIEIEDKIKKLQSEKGIIILTDMFGGTPSNLAISMMTMGKIEVVAGMNLPMLIKLAQTRKVKDLKETTQCVQEAGKKYIHSASALLQSEE